MPSKDENENAHRLLFPRLRKVVLDSNLLVAKKSSTDWKADWGNPVKRLLSKKILAPTE